MKQKIFIRSWNGFYPLKKKLDKSEFSNYYKTYYSNYEKNNINSSTPWLSNKIKISREIAAIISPFKKILSVGCGNGLIEKNLLKELPSDIFIKGIDPYINKSQELNLSNIKIEKKSIFHKSLSKYDVVFMNTVDYCLDDKQYKRIVKRIRSLSKNGLLMSQLLSPNLDYLCSIKYKISTFLKSIPISPYVFWGWHRTLDEHLSLLKESGYNEFNVGMHYSGSYWIYAK
ncbi:class I SAM-dependent methyltransferase [Prochlorococcus sp. AH-716-I07]|nr:class I SAM-dependent methyltransferase [Prochlorococcus sp. AH-716-I07]